MNTNTERLVVGGGALVLGLLLGWMVRGVASYDVNEESSTAYDDWRVICSAASNKDGACQMVANITDPKTKQVGAQISITRDPKLGQVVAFMLPPNVNLEAGLGLKLGNTDPKVYKYRTCTATGCISVTPIDDKTIDAVGSSDKVTLMSMSALPGALNRQDLDVSRKGFNAARKAYLSSNRKRTGLLWRLF